MSKSWPLMTAAELHSFGIEVVLQQSEKEGVTVESVNLDPSREPQIFGARWGQPAMITVRTACFPGKGSLSVEEADSAILWARNHQATAFFASVGIACVAYPDRSAVTEEADMSLPIKNGGYHIAYEGLVIMTTSDRVRIAPQR